jgi:hypothetical protein
VIEFLGMKPILIATFALGAVEREICLHQHRICVRSAPTIGADSDADRDVNLVAVEQIGQRKRCLNILRQDPSIRRLAHLALQHRKFVATEPGDQVALPNAVPETTSHFLKQ